MMRHKPEIVIFCGLPASGKTTYYNLRFAETHVLVSKDRISNNHHKRQRQRHMIEAALRLGKSVVVDNTNPTVEDRAELISLARLLGVKKVICYHFVCDVPTAIERNEKRTAHVPKVAIYTIAKKLVPPTRDEGFDELYEVGHFPPHAE